MPIGEEKAPALNNLRQLQVGWHSNSRLWPSATLIANPLTAQVTDEVHSLRELGNGLCYQAADGTWLDSEDLVETTTDGAEAIRGPLKAHFNSDIATPAAITLDPGSMGRTVRHRNDYYDYPGLAYYGGHVYSVWADNSNSLLDNPTRLIHLD